MGGLWAATLRLANNEVTLLGKNKKTLNAPDAANPLPTPTLQQESPCGQQNPTATLSLSKSFELASPEQQVEVFFTTPEMLDSDAISQLIVATKSTAVLAAIEDVIDKLAENATVICLANGMGYHTRLTELLAEKHKNIQLYCAATSDGAMLQRKVIGKQKQALEILHTGLGETNIGLLSNTTEPKQTSRIPLRSDDDQVPPHQLLRAFSLSGLKITVTPNIAPFLWRKFFINCAINPLTALFRCRNGELVSNRQYKTQLIDLCRELDQLLSIVDIDTIDPLAVGSSSPHKANTDPETVRSLAETVALATSANQSSMLTDILENRPTELQYLNQYAQSIARQKNLHCPINDSLVKELIALETPSPAPKIDLSH